MNKTEIITNLNRAHSAFWDTAILLPNANVSINGKWSVAQNVQHIIISLTRVNSYLTLPKSSIESKFGLSNRVSDNNEKFIGKYLNALANGVKSTAPFIPESNLETDIKELVGQGKNALESFISNLQNWSEDELERYICPHPVLGKTTVREILYFTIYHVEHHNETIKIMK
jgi:hypothetical protein